MGFILHPDFEGTSHALGELQLCHVRLHDDARFPWLILIPRRYGARDLVDLSPGDQARLMQEIAVASEAVRAVGTDRGSVEKLNVAALGNVTPQLHVHVIGRRSDDAAWPRPVWGVGQAEPWRDRAANASERFRAALGLTAG